LLQDSNFRKNLFHIFPFHLPKLIEKLDEHYFLRGFDDGQNIELVAFGVLQLFIGFLEKVGIIIAQIEVNRHIKIGIRMLFYEVTNNLMNCCQNSSSPI